MEKVNMKKLVAFQEIQVKKDLPGTEKNHITTIN